VVCEMVKPTYTNVSAISAVFFRETTFFQRHLGFAHNYFNNNTGWCTKCHTIDCAHNTFLLLQKHLTSGTELILISWKIVPNEEHVQCDHRFASQTLPCIRHNFSTQVFRKRAAQLYYVGHELRYIFWPPLEARKCSAAQGFLKTCVEKLRRMQGFVFKRL